MAYFGIFCTFIFLSVGIYIYKKYTDCLELKQNIQEVPVIRKAAEVTVVQSKDIMFVRKNNIRNEKYCQALVQHWPNCEIDFTAPSVEELCEKIKV